MHVHAIPGPRQAQTPVSELAQSRPLPRGRGMLFDQGPAPGRSIATGSRLNHDLSHVRVHTETPESSQPGRPGRNVAWATVATLNRPALQRTCACGADTGHDDACTGCATQPSSLYRQAAGSGTSVAPPVVHEALRSPSARLDSATQTLMQARLGTDLSHVRVHTGERAAASARAVNALAYTVGSSIVFDRGRFAPHHAEGQRLLAHELAHTIQQRGAPPPAPSRPLSIAPDDTGAELEARTIAATIATGHRAAVAADPRRREPGSPACRATAGPPPRARVDRVLQRQAAASPHYRDCVPAVTGVPNADELLENGRQRALEFVGAALSRLAAAPAAGSTYETALNRHFATPSAADRATILANFGQILRTLRVDNYICNSQNICAGEQAFWIADDDLVHVCRPFWTLSITCRAIILIHEGAHDVGLGTGAHPPNRGSAAYPTGNAAAPAGETPAGRMDNPDAYAFFAAHVFRDTDTGLTCF